MLPNPSRQATSNSRRATPCGRLGPCDNEDATHTGGPPVNARTLQEDDRGTELEVLSPVLFNTWKHHAGALRARIDAVAGRGPAGLVEMGTRLAVLGTRLVDLYTGALSPRELSGWVLQELTRIDRLAPPRFQAWLLEAE